MKTGLYKHHNGDMYNVLHVAINANNHDPDQGQKTVVYQAEGGGAIYTRDQAEFFESFPGAPARFTYVQEDPSIATHARIEAGKTLLYRARSDGKFDFFSPMSGKWASSSFDGANLKEMGIVSVEEAICNGLA